MDKVNDIKEQFFSIKTKISSLLIIIWLIGIVFAYLFFSCMNKTVYIGYKSKYLYTVLLVSLFIQVLTAFIFHFLFNSNYEKYSITKNIRTSNYISKGLELLNERFVLIDAENKTFEFLYVPEGKEAELKTNSYDKFITHFIGFIAKPYNRIKFAEILQLPALVNQLILKDMYFAIPVELEIDGTKKWDLLTFIVVEKDEQQIQKILLIRQDITDAQKKSLEQQELLEHALDLAEKASKAKSTFLFNMSHDIRTPMNAILGFTTMAKKHFDEPIKALEYLDKVEMSSQHLLHILNDILDMARIDSGKIELESAPINLYKESYATDALFRSAMEEKKIDFSVRVDIQDDVVLGDEVRMKQIVINLVSNALKYTKPGGKVELQYLQTPSEKEGYANYEISVSDNGIGMSEEYQQHLFEAFERERSATVSGIQGTGLGLAISKQLTDLMGGTLICNSTLLKGTKFILKLQFPIAGYVNDKHKNQVDTSVFKGKHIMLVEDNDLNREIAVDVLEELGFSVEEAKDGVEAVEKISKSTPQKYEMILMDIQMPYMDGYHAARSIRALKNKKLSEIPIIAMTANAFEEDKKKAFAAGMNAHMSKPIDEKQIIETLYQFV